MCILIRSLLEGKKDTLGPLQLKTFTYLQSPLDEFIEHIQRKNELQAGH